MSERSVQFKGFRVIVQIPDTVAQVVRRIVHPTDTPPPPAGLVVGSTQTVNYHVRKATDGIPLIQERIDWLTANKTPPADDDADAKAVAREIAGISWYHTIELPHGIVTKGFYDHRTLVSVYGIPDDLKGKRVLDVATADGFWAFEFERRGAKVTALDIDTTSEIDVPAQVKQLAAERGYNDPIGSGFAIAHRLLKSNVERVLGSVYDLDPDRLGRFDLVHAGDILLHLRDPILALQQIRRVTAGSALLADVFDPRLSEQTKDPTGLVRYLGGWNTTGWWTPSLNTLVQMVADAGFPNIEVVATYRLSPPGLTGGPWRAVLRVQ